MENIVSNDHFQITFFHKTDEIQNNILIIIET